MDDVVPIRIGKHILGITGLKTVLAGAAEQFNHAPAAVEAGVAADIEKVTDMMKIAGFGVFGTAAVVVDGEVKSVGKIPKKDEVLSWLK